ncbi:MAG: ComF family protein, partial [Planctomycetaceae bacterium]
MPPHCAVCGVDLGAAAAERAAVCAACRSTLCRDGERCTACGRPGPAAGCAACRRRRPAWGGIVVLGPYADELRGAVLRAKRPAGDRVAAALAALLAARHRDALAGWAVDVVVPVPMHWARRMLRGTSAADELARGVAADRAVRWHEQVEADVEPPRRRRSQSPQPGHRRTKSPCPGRWTPRSHPSG